MVYLLRSNKNQPVSHKQLYRYIYACKWKKERTGSGALRAMKKRIQQKFKAVDASFNCLVADYGKGYRWVDTA
jgi:hypothetical protein